MSYAGLTDEDRAMFRNMNNTEGPRKPDNIPWTVWEKMSEDDKKWIGKGTVSTDIKIDIDGISESINNYINATHVPPVLEPTLRAYASLPKEKKDPDLDKGLASILGGYPD